MKHLINTKNEIILFIFTFFLLTANCFAQGVAINTSGANADASALLDLSSTTQGTLITRMTTADRDLISNPAEGLQIFNTDTKCIEYFIFGYWQKVNCGFNCGVENLIDNRDGNTYQTIKIGNQCWMKENLKYLPSVIGSATGSTTIPYYYVLGYNGTDVSTAKSQANYLNNGALYNWASAKAACPTGWHLPSDNEWKQLEMHLGMSQLQADATSWRGNNEGGKLKTTTTWEAPNTGATNSSGFTALPTGCRLPNGSFLGSLYWAQWANYWCIEESGTNAWVRYLRYDISLIFRNTDDKQHGFSVRCIKDY